tara:strand:- start:236 stop:691 length:456 start_codon:yes stop_codon:yes gene_type:complete
MAKKLPNDALLTEIFQQVSSAKTKAEKIKLLQQYNNDGLRACLIINFDESLEFLLPTDGEIPYKKNDVPVGTEHSRLDHEFRKFYLFFKGGDTSLSGVKREQTFISLLEGLHQDEAEMFILCTRKDLQSKYRITKQVVESAFPKIEWGNRG